MTKRALLFLICGGLALAQTATKTAPAFTPTVAAPELHLEADNMSDIQRKLFTYAQSGQYDREITQVVKPAHDWLEARTARVTPGEKLAVVFDIDETAISNLNNMINCGFCSSGAQARLFAGVRLPSIPQVRELYNFAKSKGLAVFFITGRYDSGRELTTQDLKNGGYANWDDLLMRPSGDSDTAAVMKAGLRQSIESKGYKIILNIGDQISDLAGGHSERTYKLPDPFYFVE